ncbi:coenzyme F420-0:L-glutamate ligase [Paracraurococcus lichenis]|uniref:Coenzyme F420-0:L-glutamate ligase n=1 Tax=Paracraurococcus lichenis TaxID=3064888 RepID=A0ABT9DZD1_9PROT|nr:coenzyme F420-0:L-glutamate ligase [Paracraurococcus sp. LOR1-02]MDO9709251.1 coenzyme F420-0:L-glutamate ligase [Paracraurococcus sp. LOR1-02]
MSASLSLTALPGLPMVQAGDDLGALLAEGMARAGLSPQPGDVLAVAQKVVSKAEGRSVPLASVAPSAAARALAEKTGKDPRLVELILSESRRVVRARPNLIIVEHRLGFVMANAGIDQSNVGQEGHALLLPVDPDASAARLSARLGLAVVITDSFGRAWRRGTVGIAIGAAGLPALLDLRGQPDLFGRTLQVSITGFADEIAAAAGLVMGQGAEGQPAVLLRGLAWDAPAAPASELVRVGAEDLFR